MSAKAYGPVEYVAPSVNATQGNYTLVDDAAQANYPLGGTWNFFDSSGFARTLKYVQYSPSALGTWAQGTPLYYTNGTRQVVSGKYTDALTWVTGSNCAAAWSFAGVQLASTEPSAIGDYIWIQTAGYSAAYLLPSSTALGDVLVLSNSPTSQPGAAWVRVGAGSDLGCIGAAVTASVIRHAALSGGGLGKGWLRNSMWY